MSWQYRFSGCPEGFLHLLVLRRRPGMQPHREGGEKAFGIETVKPKVGDFRAAWARRLPHSEADLDGF